MRTGWVLGGLLVATNAAWAVAWFVASERRDEATSEAVRLDGQAARLRRDVDQRDARIAQLSRKAATAEAAAREAVAAAAAPTPAPAVSSPPPKTSQPAPTRAASGSSPAVAPATTPTRPDPAKIAAAATGLARIKADVLQIEDAARRERGLSDLGDALRSGDAATAGPALAALHEIRDVKYDQSRFRPDVLQQLDSASAVVRRAATYALMQIDRAPADVERLLARAEAAPTPDVDLLHVIAMLSQNRVEGRLSALYVKALAVDDPRAAETTANLLRSVWVSREVEDAVVEAWRRRPRRQGDGDGLWPYVFGQVLPEARESRVRAVFELLAGGNESARYIAGRAITNKVDESARAAAAQLAVAALGTAPTSSFRDTYLDVVRVNGGRDQVEGLRKLAANEMLGDDVRAKAAKIADELERAR